MDGFQLGRLSADELGKKVLHDAPEKQVAALMSKVDELTTALAALCAKLDADAGVTDTDYAATISDSVAKIELYI
jgi:hypothetical protein